MNNVGLCKCCLGCKISTVRHERQSYGRFEEETIYWPNEIIISISIKPIGFVPSFCIHDSPWRLRNARYTLKLDVFSKRKMWSSFERRQKINWTNS